LREDVETYGRRAKVRFGRSFAQDARRRDFTINALSLARDGRIDDPVDGMADLAAHRVRFIGDPAARIREDYLRILRFFRFHAEYAEGPLDPAGFAAAIRGRAGLAVLSRERIGAEFLKLLSARRAPEVVGALSDAGFLCQLAGGVGELGRLARVVAAGAPVDAIRRLGALAVMVVEDADRLQENLRLSNAARDRLAAYAAALARLKSLPAGVGEADVRRAAATQGVDALRDVWTAAGGEPGLMLGAGPSAQLARFIEGEEPAPELPLRGADLLARGIAAGPAVGAMMADARRLWLEWGCPTEEGVRADLVTRLLGAQAAP
jgi:poly(A) polymerase